MYSSKSGTVLYCVLLLLSTIMLTGLAATLISCAADGSFVVVAYENRPDVKSMLQWSSEEIGITYRSGALAPHNVRRYHSADRPAWLERELEDGSSSPVSSSLRAAKMLMMGDAHDMLILCNASELMARRRRLAPLSDVVVGGEPIFWPGRARYGGVALAKQYPRAPGNSPLRYVNAGTQMGSPAALLGLIQCMRAALPGFPDNCPADSITPHGEGPSTFTRFWNDSTPYHHKPSVVLRKAGWGWDQACFHYYLLEQQRGALPDHCPKMVIDYSAELVVSIGGFARKLKWSDDGRVTFTLTGARPCVLHGNGIQGKPLIKKALRHLARARSANFSLSWRP